jgi:UbiD family decarboxylase
MSCGVLDPVKPQRYNVYDRAHADLREFIERTRAADELLQIKGANWNLEIGALAEIVNHARPEPPAILFEDVPDYPKGMRLFSGATNSSKRLAIAVASENPVHSRSAAQSGHHRRMIALGLLFLRLLCDLCVPKT